MEKFFYLLKMEWRTREWQLCQHAPVETLRKFKSLRVVSPFQMIKYSFFEAKCDSNLSTYNSFSAKWVLLSQFGDGIHSDPDPRMTGYCYCLNRGGYNMGCLKCWTLDSQSINYFNRITLIRFFKQFKTMFIFQNCNFFWTKTNS